jgi:hypothetical protein
MTKVFIMKARHQLSSGNWQNTGDEPAPQSRLSAVKYGFPLVESLSELHFEGVAFIADQAYRRGHRQMTTDSRIDRHQNTFRGVGK